MTPLIWMRSSRAKGTVPNTRVSLEQRKRRRHVAPGARARYEPAMADELALRDTIPAELRAGGGAAVARAFMTALAALHAADWRGLGLADFGRPEGFLERQVVRWSKQLDSYRTRPLPDMDRLAAWLQAHRPPGEPPTLIHGDYHLDNVIFARALPPRVAAIFDWETATLGDP